MTESKIAWNKYPDTRPKKKNVRYLITEKDYFTGKLQVEVLKYRDGYFHGNKFLERLVVAWAELPEPCYGF